MKFQRPKNPRRKKFCRHKSRLIQARVENRDTEIVYCSELEHEALGIGFQL